MRWKTWQLTRTSGRIANSPQLDVRSGAHSKLVAESACGRKQSSQSTDADVEAAETLRQRRSQQDPTSTFIVSPSPGHAPAALAATAGTSAVTAARVGELVVSVAKWRRWRTRDESSDGRSSSFAIRPSSAGRPGRLLSEQGARLWSPAGSTLHDLSRPGHDQRLAALPPCASARFASARSACSTAVRNALAASIWLRCSIA